MALIDSICKRKSTRKYDMTTLDDKILAQIADFARNIKPLYSDIKVEYRLTNEKEIRNIIPVKAPHYFIISSENKDGYLTNVGFMFQQMDLFLSSLGLGSCWLGMAKPTTKINTGLEFVIILAFGKSMGTPFREIGEFNRKTLAEISDKADGRLEVARLAPSAKNSQPWYFAVEGNIIHTYCIKLGTIKSLILQKMNKIDMGIVLAHLYVANSETFELYNARNPQEIKGYYYICSVKI